MQNEATSFYKTRREPQVGSRPFALRRMTCCVMLACCDLALANPTAPQVLTGSAGFAAPNARTLHVTNAPGTIINWDSFSIGAGEVTKFIQQSPSSAVLNRVVTGAPMSQIHGQLLSNGRVFLINPAGILVGATGVIDTAGFVGSTLNMTDADFLAGKLRFEGDGERRLDHQPGLDQGGTGREHRARRADDREQGRGDPNSGIIQADGGEIVLAAGQKVTIGSLELEGVQFEVQAPTDSVLNLGKLLADDGAVGVFAGTLRHSGDIRANALARDASGANRAQGAGRRDARGGKHHERKRQNRRRHHDPVDDGTTLVGGNVSATRQRGKGGDIRVLGERAGVVEQRDRRCFGRFGGGQILIGGDYRGGNPAVQNASRTFVGDRHDAARRCAHLGRRRQDHRVVEREPRGSTAALSARGGATAGNGGFVETSGQGHPDCRRYSRRYLRPAGRGGTWLLDPKNIIVGGGPEHSRCGRFADGGGTDTIDPWPINGAAATVILQANNDITFNDAIAMASAVALTAQAGRSIDVNANVRVNNGTITLVGNDNTTAAGAGVQPANRDTDQVAAITMAPGTSLSAGGAITILMNNGVRAREPQAPTPAISRSRTSRARQCGSGISARPPISPASCALPTWLEFLR